MTTVETSASLAVPGRGIDAIDPAHAGTAWHQRAGVAQADAQCGIAPSLEARVTLGASGGDVEPAGAT